MRIIFNGDDFGITRGCNAGIIDCYKYGLMKSTSMMTNMPYAKEAADLMKDYPDLSVGIHFNLTVGYPLNKDLKTIIKEDGSFNKKILTNTIPVDLDEIRKELTTQFNIFIELTGKLPTHINSHHCIEQIHGVGDIVMEFSHAYHIPVREFIVGEQNSEFEIPKLCFLSYPNNDVKDIIRWIQEQDLKENDVIEVLGHPGYVDYDLMKISSLTTGRCQDAHTFVCDEMKEYVSVNNVFVTSFEALTKLIKK